MNIFWSRNSGMLNIHSDVPSVCRTKHPCFFDKSPMRADMACISHGFVYRHLWVASLIIGDSMSPPETTTDFQFKDQINERHRNIFVCVIVAPRNLMWERFSVHNVLFGLFRNGRFFIIGLVYLNITSTSCAGLFHQTLRIKEWYRVSKKFTKHYINKIDSSTSGWSHYSL